MIIIYVIIGLALLILVHELGHFFAAKIFGVRVDEFGIGFPPKIFSKKYGETEYSINILPLGGFVRIHGEDRTTIDDDDPDFKRSFAYQPAWKRSVIILAGVFMNILLGWILITGIFMVGAPQQLGVASVVENSPAAEAGIEAGDTIINIERGEAVIMGEITAENFINFIQEDPEGPFKLTLEKPDGKKEIELSGRANPPEGEGNIGVALVDLGIKKQTLGGALIEGLRTTWEILKSVAVGFYTIVTRIFTSPQIVENIAGPVGIFVITKQAGSIGLVYLIQLVAVISLNLVIINLIPFPALDGGRFLFILIEKIKGTPVSNKFQMAINAVGFILLIVLMLIVTVQDVGRFIL